MAVHWIHQVLLLGAALHPFLTQPGFGLGIAPTQTQDLALGRVEPHEAHTSQACPGPTEWSIHQIHVSLI